MGPGGAPAARGGHGGPHGGGRRYMPQEGDAYAGHASQRSQGFYDQSALTQQTYGMSLNDSQPQTQGYHGEPSYQTQQYSQHSQHLTDGSHASFHMSGGDGSQPAFELSSQDFVLNSSQDDLYRWGDAWGAGQA